MAALALEILYCNLILKPFAVRIRPCGINTAVRLLGPRPGSGSADRILPAVSSMFIFLPMCWQGRFWEHSWAV